MAVVLGQEPFFLGVVLGPENFFTNLDFIERRPGDVYVARADEFEQVTIEEGQQQRADVVPVRVCVHQQANLVVA